MKRLTARSLVARYLRQSHLSQPRVEEAVRLAQQQGWVCAFAPRSREPDRVVVLVQESDPMAPLLRLTWLASLSGFASAADLPRALVESRAGSLHELEAGRHLARFGLVMLRPVSGQSLPLLAVNPKLAGIVNRLRYGGSRKGRDQRLLIQAALGLAERPRRLGALSDEKLIEAASLYERLEVDASGLLERTDRSHPVSQWQMEEVLRTSRGDAA